jgi:hypothetical protein
MTPRLETPEPIQDHQERRLEMSTTLKLTREGFGMELRRGTFDIVLDGSSAGSLERHQTVELPVEPGRHTLRLRKGRYSSRDHAFDAADGEVVIFHCNGARIWPMYVASIVMPNLAISLKRE